MHPAQAKSKPGNSAGSDNVADMEDVSASASESESESSGWVCS